MSDNSQLWNETWPRPMNRSAPGAGTTSPHFGLGMVMCIPAYTLSASLIESGMSAMQAVLTVLLANTIVSACRCC